MIEAALLVVFPCLVAFAGASDLFTMTIPNRVSLMMIAGFAMLAPAIGMAPLEIGFHLIAAGIALSFGLAFFAFGWMGGGDAKLMTVVALWLGLTPALGEFLLLTSVYGAVLTLAILGFRKDVLLPIAAYRVEWIARLHDNKTGIPYGITIAIAALQAYPGSIWFRAIM
ncbi:A24 family peptidase [Stappia indica]|uniref:Prepilin peptidase CpaA n=1 Tax=Stappia indica TaxID=538381 RepID=A0A285T9J2_9HYPH|nr:prepilin peptidase [Stappia indica]SOC17646.1 prepilin peptidase CpaA [Stappia indica]